MTASPLCLQHSSPTGRLPTIAGAPNIERGLTKIAAYLQKLSRPATHALDRGRDGELLHRVARGDVAALRALYDEHASRALAIANRILRDSIEAEDVVQETFIEVWRRSAQFDGARGGAVAWIVTIARSRAIDRLRASGTAGRAIAGVASSPELLLSAQVPPPHEAAERRRDEVRVAGALATLPPEQREAIELAYFEGMTQSEIATQTGSPLGTVKMRVKLAITKLAALLREKERE
jgi:RNA polymerase sigma-70 factor, ECF subfamily